MKVLLVNGSPNKEGNTYHACDVVAKRLEEKGIEAEIFNLAGTQYNSCIACGSCYRTQDNTCILKDGLDDLIQKFIEADGIVLASPIHYADISGLMKSAMDRLFYVCGNNGNFLRHKVGASLVAVRRTGGIAGFHTLNNYLLYSEMFIATSSYWNVVHGTSPKEIYQDEEGLDILNVLADNMAYLLKTVAESKVEKPEMIEKRFTNFIR